jgi:Right handed beta helix region
MESMDNVRERIEALEQQMNVMGAHTRTVERRLRWRWGIASAGLLVSLLSLAPLSQAADFACAAGDVACLIDAINQANTNGEANTITLKAGTYTLTAADNNTDGPNGLPSVTSTLTIRGQGAESTSIERNFGFTPPSFRLGHVAATGNLTFDRLTLRGGDSGSADGGNLFNQQGTLTLTNSTLTSGAADTGGGIFNQRGTMTLAETTVTDCSALEGGGIENNGGRVVLVKSTVAHNNTLFGGAGILNNSEGTVTLLQSTLRGNFGAGAGGGLNNFDTSSTVHIIDSTIADNSAAVGGGISNSGTLTILNSTIAGNSCGGFVSGEAGGGIANFGGRGPSAPGALTILNSTIADNQILVQFGSGRSGGGLAGSGIVLLNTLLARNTAQQRPDCSGTVTSLGTNLIGDPTGCTITLQPNDLTGDSGLDTFTDDGTPGNGHFPLLPTSQAIDAGNDAACPRTDQLGEPRVGPCDIGAIEFQGKHQKRH